MNTIVRIILVGIGATLLMDIWSFLLSLFKIKTLDYKLVGRWIGHISKGRFMHSNITQIAEIKHEGILGWTAHYLIGITFSFVVVLLFSTSWLHQPTLLPALIVGIVTIIAPFFIMQPAFGFGIAASKLKNPSFARLMSFISHSIYGFGLYLSAFIIQYIITKIQSL